MWIEWRMEWTVFFHRIGLRYRHHERARPTHPVSERMALGIDLLNVLKRTLNARQLWKRGKG